eukprot:CAMPEP_0197244480 /NCGR_PEP_ID=MMETSP1429-20130617/9592_1 /TAXON_ID=49237 /ORGANISM="Chaetoceros  sp., Strain UNC1202" /LENGTH=386 /DNA_ID=CAMNT_0042704849 /DNA_START=40 /DNA_END=1200 /DNA_ORIENTATION=+
MSKITEERLRKRASEILIGKSKEARIFDEDAENNVPKFDPKEVEFGAKLGKGGFCTVFEVKNITPSDLEKKPSATSQDAYSKFVFIQNKDFISTNCIRDGKARYAIKRLTGDLFEKGDHQHFLRGVIDLACEVKYLAVLKNHPHVIKMRAVASTEYCSKDFFIMMDKLYGTLEDRVDIWKKKAKKLFMKKTEKEDLFFDRMMVAHDLSSAMAYLHENDIIYRDLKPENIGFDVRDDVKIFDLGLAKEIPKNRRPSDTFDLTENTGSPRYMAPEVALNQPYNEKSDVYSFGLLMSYILDFKLPFQGFDRRQMMQKVYKGKVRPKVNSKWPKRTKSLLPRCWDRDIANRPSFEEVKETLNDEAQQLGGDGLLLDITGRSEKSVMAKGL